MPREDPRKGQFALPARRSRPRRTSGNNGRRSGRNPERRLSLPRRLLLRRREQARLPGDDAERRDQFRESRLKIEKIVARQIGIGAGQSAMDDIDHQFDVVPDRAALAPSGSPARDARLDGVEARHQFQQAGHDDPRLPQGERRNEKFLPAESDDRRARAIDFRIRMHVRPPC